ncbi:MAG: hypothetical protein ACYDA1_01745 [Vulcanimicrobiaceae bacterium]
MCKFIYRFILCIIAVNLNVVPIYAQPHVDPCKKSAKAQVVCAYKHFLTVKYVVVTMDAGGSHSIIKYAFPEKSASVRHTYPFRPTRGVNATVFIGLKAWQLEEGNDPSRVHWAKILVSMNVVAEARSKEAALLLALKHSTSPFVDRGPVLFGTQKLERFNYFFQGISTFVDIDTTKDLPIRILTPGSVTIYSNFNRKIVITAPSTFGHPVIY